MNRIIEDLAKANSSIRRYSSAPELSSVPAAFAIASIANTSKHGEKSKDNHNDAVYKNSLKVTLQNALSTI